MRYPDLTVQPLSATVAKYLVPDIYVKQSSGPAKTSNVTLANDAELAGISLDVGTYKIYALLLATATTGDLRTAWSFTGAWSGIRALLGPGPGTELASFADSTMRVSAVSLTTPATYGMHSASVPVGIQEVSYNVVVTSAGDMAIQWAQDTSDASPTSLVAGSAVEVCRIA